MAGGAAAGLAIPRQADSVSLPVRCMVQRWWAWRCGEVAMGQLGRGRLAVVDMLRFAGERAESERSDPFWRYECTVYEHVHE